MLAITFISKEETTTKFLAKILFEVKNTEVIRTIHYTVPWEEERTDEESGKIQFVTFSKEVDFTFTDTRKSELTITYIN